MKILFWTVVGIGLALIAFSAYARLAPSPASDWHPDIAAEGYAPPDNAAVFCPAPGSRYARTDATNLNRLERIALAWPRTKRLAYTEEAGNLTHVTWISRSLIFGFPDYTTAMIRPIGDICIVARQRFGKFDGGVNAARVQAWVQQLYGLNEAPDLGWPDQ